MDVTECAGQGVIGYSPDGGYLIQGRREAKGQLVPISKDYLLEIVMANPVDQRVFGVGADDSVVFVHPGLDCDGTARRYLARYSWFECVTAEKARNGDDTV